MAIGLSKGDERGRGNATTKVVIETLSLQFKRRASLLRLVTVMALVLALLFCASAAYYLHSANSSQPRQAIDRLHVPQSLQVTPVEKLDAAVDEMVSLEMFKWPFLLVGGMVAIAGLLKAFTSDSVDGLMVPIIMVMAGAVVTLGAFAVIGADKEPDMRTSLVSLVDQEKYSELQQRLAQRTGLDYRYLEAQLTVLADVELDAPSLDLPRLEHELSSTRDFTVPDSVLYALEMKIHGKPITKRTARFQQESFEAAARARSHSVLALTLAGVMGVFGVKAWGLYWMMARRWRRIQELEAGVVGA